MPEDIGILTLLDKPRLDDLIIKSTGDTDYSWCPYTNDVQLDSVNQIITLSGLTKLAQGIVKIVLTEKGSHPEDSLYGTELNTIIGSKTITGNVAAEQFADIRSEIIDALKHYNLINRDNPDSDEVIETIDDIRIVQDLDEPRAINVQISVTSESGQPIRIEVPQVVA